MKMQVVHKYPLVFGYKVVNMPRDAVVVSVAFQHGLPTLWALFTVDSDAKPDFVDRPFLIAATGEAFDGEYCGTFFEGPFVWHVIERVT